MPLARIRFKMDLKYDLFRPRMDISVSYLNFELESIKVFTLDTECPINILQEIWEIPFVTSSVSPRAYWMSSFLVFEFPGSCHRVLGLN